MHITKKIIEFYKREGLGPKQYHFGDEHPRLETVIQEILAGQPGKRFLEIGFQSGGTAFPVIHVFEGEYSFFYTGVDNLQYHNAVSVELLKKYLHENGVRSDCWEFLVGDATKVLSGLKHPYDVILIDHYKPLYLDALKAILFTGLLKENGVILFHDVLDKAEQAWVDCSSLLHKFKFETEIRDDVPSGLAIARAQGPVKVSFWQRVFRRL